MSQWNRIPPSPLRAQVRQTRLLDLLHRIRADPVWLKRTLPLPALIRLWAYVRWLRLRRTVCYTLGLSGRRWQGPPPRLARGRLRVIE